jgi:hypothetical protein
MLIYKHRVIHLCISRMSLIPEKEGEKQYFDNFIVSRKSSSHETDKVRVSLKHKVEQYTTNYLSTYN